MASQPRRPTLTSSPPREPQLSSKREVIGFHIFMAMCSEFLCGMLAICQRFAGTYCLHLQKIHCSCLL
jgi:hypothetical protein